VTIASTTAKSGPYSGNGVTTVFNYGFKVFDEGDIVVTLLNSVGTEVVQTITTEYTVTGVGDEAGGTIVMVTPPANGEQLVVTRSVPLVQELDLQNRKAVNPVLIERGLDLVTQMLQDLNERVDRSFKIDVFGTVDLDELLVNVNAIAALAAELSTVAGVTTELVIVAGDSAAINALADRTLELDALAARLVEIDALYAIRANIDLVAAVDDDVAALGPIAAAISTLADIAADISAVVAIAADVTAVANIDAAVTSIAQKYQGAAAADPTVRALDGSALQVGDFYLNTVSGDIRFVTSTGPVVWSELATLIDETTLLSMGVTSAASDLNALIPIGVPFPVWDHIAGIPVPSNAGDAKFIKLTAGLTGVGQYNEGLLGSESVSGSAPAITATATILVGPATGQTVPLVNTEQAFLRPTTSAGVLQAQSTQEHGHKLPIGWDGTNLFAWRDWSNSPVYGSEVQAGANRGTVALSGGSASIRVAYSQSEMRDLSGETRPRNRSATFYMRIA
jgi:hypothetical protein